jgi:L-lactate dehydrogenase (cytochrome)
MSHAIATRLAYPNRQSVTIVGDGARATWRAVMAALGRILDLDDFERAVRRRLPRAVYGYVAHGSETEASLRTNRAAFEAWRLTPRVLRGIAQRSQGITLFGRDYTSPFGIAPMGGSALVAFDGHAAMAKAAAQARVPFILSANSIIPMEEVASAGRGIWFAAYQSATQAAVEAIAERAHRAGVEVMVMTADVPAGSNREADARAGFGFPIRPNLRLGWDVLTHPSWLFGTLLRTFAKRGIPHIVNLEGHGGPSLFSKEVQGIAAHPRLSWDHVRIMRRAWTGPLVIKGILSVDDARIARDCGADGIIVSNHGGRQLDYAATPLQVLPEIAAATEGLTVMVDSGFRRGTDVLKALALGADCVFVGRPFLYAAAMAGEAGVRHAIALLAREIDIDMTLLGLGTTSEMTREALSHPP